MCWAQRDMLEVGSSLWRGLVTGLHITLTSKIPATPRQLGKGMSVLPTQDIMEGRAPEDHLVPCSSCGQANQGSLRYTGH